MDYSKVFPILMATECDRVSLDDPDCSPHPLDILAIFALYQTR